MDGLSLSMQYERSIEETRELVDEYQAAEIEAAQAEMDYQRAKNLAIVGMRACQIPATIIQQQVKGEPSVVQKLYERDVKKALARAAYERILVAKKDTDRLRDMQAREWAEARYE